MLLHVSVILSTGGCLPLVPGGVCHTPHTLPSWQTPPVQTPSLGRHTPLADTTPGQTPPAQCMLGYTPCPVHAGIHPPAQCMLGYGRQVGSRHPTGMHSCLELNCLSRFLYFSSIIITVYIRFLIFVSIKRILIHLLKKKFTCIILYRFNFQN